MSNEVKLTRGKLYRAITDFMIQPQDVITAHTNERYSSSITPTISYEGDIVLLLAVNEHIVTKSALIVSVNKNLVGWVVVGEETFKEL